MGPYFMNISEPDYAYFCFQYWINPNIHLFSLKATYTKMDFQQK